MSSSCPSPLHPALAERPTAPGWRRLVPRLGKRRPPAPCDTSAAASARAAVQWTWPEADAHALRDLVLQHPVARDLVVNVQTQTLECLDELGFVALEPTRPPELATGLVSPVALVAQVRIHDRFGEGQFSFCTAFEVSTTKGRLGRCSLYLGVLPAGQALSAAPKTVFVKRALLGTAPVDEVTSVAAALERVLNHLRQPLPYWTPSTRARFVAELAQKVGSGN
jgi:hypothetical protein